MTSSRCSSQFLYFWSLYLKKNLIDCSTKEFFFCLNHICEKLQRTDFYTVLLLNHGYLFTFESISILLRTGCLPRTKDWKFNSKEINVCNKYFFYFPSAWTLKFAYEFSLHALISGNRWIIIGIPNCINHLDSVERSLPLIQLKIKSKWLRSKLLNIILNAYNYESAYFLPR